jgi:TfoX/Sxy family transcriptional regulator of competence genes
MAYSEQLASRIQAALATHPAVKSKPMFGGLGFFHRGNMLVAVWGESLIVRVGAQAYKASLLAPDVAEFNITGKPMTGWVLVAADGIESERALKTWIDRAIDFVATLPPK